MKLFLFLLTLFVSTVSADLLYDSGLFQWNHAGKSANGAHYVSLLESSINSANVAKLKLANVFPLQSYASSNPSETSSGLAFQSDYSGNVYAIQYGRGSDGSVTGTQKCVYNIPSHFQSTSLMSPFVPTYFALSRNTPVLVPAKGSRPALAIFCDNWAGRCYAMRQDNCQLWGYKIVETHTEATITSSGLYVSEEDMYINGVSSHEILTPVILALYAGINYPCCSFRGSTFGINVDSFHTDTTTLAWKNYTTDVNGASSWGGVAYEYSLKYNDWIVYEESGNNYLLGQAWNLCAGIANYNCTVGGVLNQNCLQTKLTACGAIYDSNRNLFDAVFVRRVRNGELLAFHKSQVYDPYTVVCIYPVNPAYCSNPPNNDFDNTGLVLADGIIVDPHTHLPKVVQYVGVSSKSGIFTILDRNNNLQKVKEVRTCPGSNGGGSVWGFSYDPIQQLFVVTCTDAMSANYTTVDGRNVNVGSLSTVDLHGNIVKTFVHPITDPTLPLSMNAFQGHPTIVNDVILAPSANGNLFAIKTSTMTEIARFNPGMGSLWANPTVVGNKACFPGGYVYSPQWAFITGKFELVCYYLPSLF